MDRTDSAAEQTSWQSDPFIGRPLPRVEDLRLVRGEGRFTDDISFPSQAFAVFVRADRPHAQINRIDTTRARNCPGVVAILTGVDYIGDGLRGIAQVPIPADAVDHGRPAFADTPERRIFNQPQLPIAVDRVRYVGEAVAVVVADTIAAASDAVQHIGIDYTDLPAIVDVLDARAPGAPLIWPSTPGNVALEAEFGEADATRAAIAGADVVVEQIFRNQRIVTAQLELRSAIGIYDQTRRLYTLISGSQGVHRQRQALANCLEVPLAQVRVVSPDVGGGFGSRTNLHPEQLVVVWAARRIGRPVKWTSDRTEAFLTDYQGRDVVTMARLACDQAGRIRGLSLELLGNVGAHSVSYVPLNNGARIATTVYDIPAACVRVWGVVTNTVPTAPYRGAGRPEATFVVERLIDIAARRLNIDRVEIRRRNLINHDKLPYLTALGLTFDSGHFASNMQRALEIADWNGVPQRRAEAARHGRLLGVGIANYVESPVGAPHERVEIRILDGVIELLVGTQSSGQGHETTFAQVLADQLGVLPETVRLISGDTDAITSGGGTHSDRSMRLASTLMVEATRKIVAQARSLAAALLDVPDTQIEFVEGVFRATKRNRRLSLFEIARAIAHDPALPDNLRVALTAEAKFTGRLPAFPTGAAVCELEVDPATGAVEIRRYSSVDDAGQPINPMILHGQVHGGIAQGIGQALLETVLNAPGSGQVLTGSFLDYGLPRADMLPSFAVELVEDPTFGNPLRVKGGGESGITPSLAAIMNAVVDALSAFGIVHLDMPATAQRIWQAIRHHQAANNSRGPNRFTDRSRGRNLQK